jgi:hypothetical protein
MNTVKDFLGNDITAGCKIVYACRRGSDMHLKLMSVTSIDGNRVRGFGSDGRRTFITNVENAVVVIKAPVLHPTDGQYTD